MAKALTCPTKELRLNLGPLESINISDTKVAQGLMLAVSPDLLTPLVRRELLLLLAQPCLAAGGGSGKTVQPS